ncbi:MAG: amidohydrolase family protein [Magnetospirillum sp.]|nr:amidohydrolase family protein [Magnetospirillum sp.]
MSRTRPLKLTGGRVLDSATGAAPFADILVVDGKIEALGRVPDGDFDVLDAGDRLLIPGLINSHTHAHGALARGAVDDRVPLELFLTAAGALNGGRTLEDKYLSAALSAVEMVRRGCTSAFDLFVEIPAPSVEGVHAVGKAYADVGMRAVVAPMLADRSLYRAFPGLLEAIPEPHRARAEALATQPWQTSLATAEQAIAAWPHDRDFVRPAIAPTIPLHAADEFLVAAARLARDAGLRFQTHLAESKPQAIAAQARYGCSMVAHLDRLGVLGPEFSGAHGIWIDAEDMKRLAAKGAAVAHNPPSNLRLGSGVAAVREMLDAGVRVGIGTDASNTSDGQNMFEATRLASYLSRLRGPDFARWLSAAEAFALATEGSAALLGFEKVGRLAEGYAADIVFLRLDAPNFVPLRDARLQTVFGESGAAVDKVMIGGRLVFADGTMLTIDEARLRREAEAAAARLDTANAGAKSAAAEMSKFVGTFCLAHGSAPCPVHRRLADAL